MSNFARLTPLAFALAMSLGGSSTEAFTEIDTANFFQPGRLAHKDSLLNQRGGDAVEPAADAKPVRSAQWLNWFNCASGSWRKC